jgi:FAD:protein FMN transferase
MFAPVQRKTNLLTAVLLLLSSFIGGCNGSTENEPQRQPIALSGPTMGTQWSVTFGTQNAGYPEIADVNSRTHKALAVAIADDLKTVNALMSTWDASSELSRFNALHSTQPFAISAATLEVLRTAQRVAEATDGAYDVTRGAVFGLWGFSADTPSPDAPDPAVLNRALAESGWQALRLSGTTVTKQFPNLTVDLSSLGKGYAVDRLAALLDAEGFQHYVVNIGGEMAVKGERSPDVAWRIGIESPDKSVPSGLALNNARLASSGSYRNVRIVDGQRISHLIDGRTGYPIAHNVVAATVLHESAMLADAWATAFMVLGLEASEAYVNEQNLAVQLTVLASSNPNEPEFAVWQSPAWKALPSASAP